MSRAYITIIFLGLSLNAFAQDKSVDSSVIFTCKLQAYILHGYLFEDCNDLNEQITNTSYKLLNQKGFNNISFLKIKVQDREDLKLDLFKSKLSDNEWANYAFLSDEQDMPHILDSTLENVFDVNSTTPNDTIEALIPTEKKYFSTMSGTEYVYIAHISTMNKQELIPLLDKKGNINKYFIELINEPANMDGYVHSLLSEEVIQYCKKNKIQTDIYKHIKTQLYVEDVIFE